MSKSCLFVCGVEIASMDFCVRVEKVAGCLISPQLAKAEREARLSNAGGWERARDANRG